MKLAGRSTNKVGRLLLIVAVLIGVTLSPVLAYGQSSEPVKKPEDYIWGEILIGALLGGIAGSEILEFQITNYYCVGIEDENEFRICRAGTLASARPTLYPMLIMLGSASAIWGIGSLNNISGNIFALITGTLSGAITGAAVGGTLSRYVIDVLINPETTKQIVEGEGTPELIRRIFPLFTAVLKKYESEVVKWTLIFTPAVLSAFWGALGFNVGAKFIDK